ncbi:MAG: sulfotransferase [Candidatus Hermodarchaeota archaeon]
MTNAIDESRINKNLDFPYIGYAGYALTKFFASFKGLSYSIAKIETLLSQEEINKLTIDRPIYIVGLARAGTTIVLEMLSNHPLLAFHKYRHFPMPYFPHRFSRIVDQSRFFTKPRERVHKDGIIVTRESPEAVEEIFWEDFFENNHNEDVSSVLNQQVSNPNFEQFYRDHIKKLLINQRRSRYLAKNNYNITRLEYLQKLFPTVKILLIVRNPINHIASLIKQTKLFIEMEKENPLLIDWHRLTGHSEFGHNQMCINTGDGESIRKIRKLWKNGETQVEGWAYYWTSIYDYVMDLFEANKKIRNATLIVRHEDLCDNSEVTIDKILDHAELPHDNFEIIKNYYCKHLHKPTYYSPNFSNQELYDIARITNRTASRYGYK